MAKVVPRCGNARAAVPPRASDRQPGGGLEDGAETPTGWKAKSDQGEVKALRETRKFKTGHAEMRVPDHLMVVEIEARTGM